MERSDQVKMVSEPEVPESGFQVCEKHHKRMLQLLKACELQDQIARTEEEVKALLAMGKSDPVLDVSRVLFTIAVNAIGSQDLARLKCPLCAFRKFDFLEKIVSLVALRYQEKTTIYMPRDHARMIMPS